MKIIKRDGTEVEFNVDKIIMAVTKANNRVEAPQKLSELEINSIGKHVQDIASELTRALTVEEIQDLVENDIMSLGKYELAKRYITYRYNRSLARKANTTDGRILSLINCLTEKNCIKVGMDIKSLSEILGHASVDVTLNRYVHSSYEMKKKFLEKL